MERKGPVHQPRLLRILDQPELIAQWDRAGQLSHPNLLRLLQRGTCQVNDRSLHYVVTEYADEDLAAVLAERPLTPMEVREMLKPLLDALAYIHAEGLVHGRLKPANILAVGIRGTVKVNVRATVDASGRITSATVESQNSKYFANLTLKAVERWAFEAKDGAGDWLLRFEFTSTGTEVRTTKVSR